MPSLIDRLIDVLEEQADYYGQLLGLSEEKKDVIIRNDITALQKITGLENIVISRNTKADKNREQIMADFAVVYAADKSRFAMDTLISLVRDQPECPRLEAAISKIKEHIEKLRVTNEQNRLLIENSLDYVDFSMNLIRGAMQNEPSYYSAHGDQIDGGQGLFDAKQ